jgi:hypothetical protein
MLLAKSAFLMGLCRLVALEFRVERVYGVLYRWYLGTVGNPVGHNRLKDGTHGDGFFFRSVLWVVTLFCREVAIALLGCLEFRRMKICIAIRGVK